MVIFLLFFSFFAFLALASALGWVVDSRDGADWSPSADGFRVTRWR